MRIKEEDVYPNTKFGPMNYSGALSAIESLVALTYPELPHNWKSHFSQPVSRYVSHKYFDKNKSAQGLLELINPRMQKPNGHRTQFSTITNCELELTAPRLSSNGLVPLEEVLAFLLSGEVNFDGQARGIVAHAYTLYPAEDADTLHVSFFKFPMRSLLTPISNELLEQVGEKLDALHAIERIQTAQSALNADRLNRQRIHSPLQGGLPASNRRH